MIFLEMFVAFAATMAFAVIFNVSRSELIFCPTFREFSFSKTGRNSLTIFNASSRLSGTGT